MTSYCRAPLSFGAHQRPMVGDQKMGYTSVDHLGWLVCDGRSLTVADYGLLFNTVGYSFGGSGANFSLPDFQGRVPGMAGQGSGLTLRALGTPVGTETHTLNINEMPAHKHGSVDVTGNTNGDGVTGNESAHTHTYQDAYFAENTGGAPPKVLGTSASTDSDNNFYYRKTDGTSTTDSSDPLTQIQTSGGSSHNHSIGRTGGDQPHNNMQPTLFAANMFIYSGKVNLGYYPYNGPTTNSIL